MSRRRTLAMVLISTYLFILWLISWLTFYVIGNISLFFTEFGYLFLLTLGCVSFVFSLLILRKLLTDTKCELNNLTEKEKNVRDCYQYDQFLNPPDTDMNN
ncbi:MAG: hypothetical protein KAH91_01845 [Thermoplasmatales archaeon]|nr:hypothetical protein [Thermoplasmatales archaeon]